MCKRNNLVGFRWYNASCIILPSVDLLACVYTSLVKRLANLVFPTPMSPRSTILSEMVPGSSTDLVRSTELFRLDIPLSPQRIIQTSRNNLTARFAHSDSRKGLWSHGESLYARL